MAPDDRAEVRIARARSFLFVPGDRPERFDKAVASGADIVVLDLEDAVAPDIKTDARQAIAAWLRDGGEAMVRINASDTAWFEHDLALSDHPGLLGFMLPKAEAAAPLARVTALKPTVALVESARGIADLMAIATMPGVVRIAFGTIDLSLDLGTNSEDLLRTIGAQIVVSSRACGIAAPIDGVTTILRDADIISAATRDARARGFGAKLCIHPTQIDPVHRALRPSDDEIANAKRIIEADRAATGAAVSLNGIMIDKPIVAQAIRVLTDAGANGPF